MSSPQGEINKKRLARNLYGAFVSTWLSRTWGPGPAPGAQVVGRQRLRLWYTSPRRTPFPRMSSTKR